MFLFQFRYYYSAILNRCRAFPSTIQKCFTKINELCFTTASGDTEAKWPFLFFTDGGKLGTQITHQARSQGAGGIRSPAFQFPVLSNGLQFSLVWLLLCSSLSMLQTSQLIAMDVRYRKWVMHSNMPRVLSMSDLHTSFLLSRTMRFFSNFPTCPGSTDPRVGYKAQFISFANVFPLHICQRGMFLSAEGTGASAPGKGSCIPGRHRDCTVSCSATSVLVGRFVWDGASGRPHIPCSAAWLSKCSFCRAPERSAWIMSHNLKVAAVSLRTQRSHPPPWVLRTWNAGRM